MRSTRTWKLAALAVGLLGLGSAAAQERTPEKLAAPKEGPAQTRPGEVVLMESPPPLESRWFVRGEWMYLQRDTPRLVVATQRVPAGFVSEVAVHDLIHFDNEHGLRLSAGQVDNFGGGFEVSYFGLHEWNETASFAPVLVGALVSQFDQALLPFDFASTYEFRYTSELHNLELNARQGVWARDNVHLALLAGVRYLKVEEEFLWAAADPVGVGIYTSATENDLIGLQVGGDGAIDLTPAFAVTGMVKGGVYVNFSEQQSAILGAELLGAPFNEFGEGSDETVAATVELAVGVQWRLGDNVRLSAGYHALWVYGLALAPRQLNFSTAAGAQNGLNYTDGTVYHGPTAGFELRW